MKSLIHKPSSKSKSQAAASGTTQKSKASIPGFRDNRPEAIHQRIVQDAANSSPRVMQLQAVQAMADSHALPVSSKPVVQRIKGKDELENTYSEVKIDDEEHYTTDVEGLDKTEKTLVRGEVDGAETTTETGYKVLTLEKGETQKEWEIMTSVLKWNGRKLSTRNNFNLPVSCIESSEHVIHHHDENTKNKNHDGMPDHDQDEEKNVDLYFSEVREVESKTKHKNSRKRKKTYVTVDNTKAASASKDDIDELGPQWTDYNFKDDPALVGEGLFVQNLANGTVFHAVAVVGRKNDGQLIVLERNAGNTTGDNMHLDKKWLVNVYANEGAFKRSMGDGKKWRIGKLKITK